MQKLIVTSPLADIDVRQDDVLRQLDDLERRIARVLAEYGPGEKTGLSIFRPSEDADQDDANQDGHEQDRRDHDAPDQEPVDQHPTYQQDVRQA